MSTQSLIQHKPGDVVSDRFDPTKSYAKDELCIYGDELWKFTSEKAAGVWDSSKVMSTKIDDEMAVLKNEISSLNASLSIKGSNQRVYGEASCSTEGEKRLASLSLKAGHTYMLIGETETDNGNTISTSCGIKITSGTVEYFPQMINRTRTDNGQGCNVVTVIKCVTDCVVYVYGYVYNPGSYKYQGNLISILLD